MTATRQYTDQLEAVLKELKFIVRGKFSGKENIFDHIWKGLEKEATTLEGLDSHYNLEIGGLKSKLEKFCKDKKFPAGILTDKDVDILSKLLSLRQILAKQYFILNKLNQFNVEKIFYALGRLKRDSQRAIDDFKELDVAKQKVFLDELDNVTKKILITFKEKNFLDDDSETRLSSNLQASKTSEIIKIQEHLLMLPSMAEISKDPQGESHEFNECGRDLAHEVTELLDKYEKMLAKMGSVKAFIAYRIDDINVETQVTEFYQWLVKFGVKSSILAETENAAKDLIASLNDGALFGNAISSLAGASDKLNKLFLVLDKDRSLICYLKKLIDSFNEFMTDVEQLADQKNVLNENKVQIDKACQDASRQLTNAKKRWVHAREALEKTEKKVDRMVEHHPNTPFLAKHWWKLLIGGIVGCAAAALTAFFFVPITLTVFSILTVASVVLMGAMMGVAIAAAISKVIDSCCSTHSSFEKKSGASFSGKRPSFDDLFESSEEEKTVPDLDASEVSKSDVKAVIAPVNEVSSVCPEPIENPVIVAPVDVAPAKLVSEAKPVTNAPSPVAGTWYNPVNWFWKPAPIPSPNAAPTPAQLEEGARKTI